MLLWPGLWHFQISGPDSSDVDEMSKWLKPTVLSCRALKPQALSKYLARFDLAELKRVVGCIGNQALLLHLVESSQGSLRMLEGPFCELSCIVAIAPELLHIKASKILSTLTRMLDVHQYSTF